jgi:hypothetical protein
MTEENNDGAELIHQAIPDMAGTEPRPIKEQVLRQVWDVILDGDEFDPVRDSTGEIHTDSTADRIRTRLIKGVFHQVRKMARLRFAQYTVTLHEINQLVKGWTDSVPVTDAERSDPTRRSEAP